MIIVIACSALKLEGSQLAIDKYDTRQHRTVAKELHDLYMAGHAVYILSAEHGLIPATQCITDYDREMSPTRSKALLPQVTAAMAEIAEDWDGDDEMVVYGGHRYRGLLRFVANRFNIHVHQLIGENRGCGDHFAALKDFLRDMGEDA